MSHVITAVQTERCTTTTADITLRDDERQRCEVWTRVMGYHRPVVSFNIGKQGEFADRLHFVETPAH